MVTPILIRLNIYSQFVCHLVCIPRSRTQLDDWLESAPEDPFHVVLAAAPEDENLPVIVWGDMAGSRLLFGDSTFLFDQDGQLTKTLDWMAYHQAELDRHVWFERQVQYTIDAQGRFSPARLPALSEQRFSVLATRESGKPRRSPPRQPREFSRAL